MPKRGAAAVASTMAETISKRSKAAKTKPAKTVVTTKTVKVVKSKAVKSKESGDSVGADGRIRCFGASSEMFLHYHDHEWGHSNNMTTDSAIFEMLTLSGAQAGLSFSTILSKRSGYARVFHNYDIARIAAMTDAEMAGACADPTIVRNKLKINSVRTNAIAALKILEEFGSLHKYFWSFVDEEQIGRWRARADVPVSTPLSDTVAADLKKRGFSFVGTTIIYAFLQTIGVVNDHLAHCFVHH